MGTGEDVGPGHYGTPMPAPKGKLITGAAFQSKVERFKNPAETPFATYEVDHRPDYRSKLRRFKTEHLSFGSGKDRWNPKEVFIGQTYHLAPGPGEYEPKLHGAKAMSIMSTEDRNLDPKQVKDGPETYLKHGTFIKKTYNVLSPEEAEQRAKDRAAGLIDVSTLVGGAGGGAAGTRARLALTEGVMKNMAEG